MYVRLSSEATADKLGAVESVYRQFNPDYPFEYSFVEDEIQNSYFSEMRTKQIVQLFTLLAIFISCIGLFGFTALITQKRTKEIGIRQVLGSTISQIILVISKHYLICVGIAILIGIPLSIMIMNSWLQKFATQFDPGLVVFVLPGIPLLLLTFLTISFHALRTVRQNPIKSLRYD